MRGTIRDAAAASRPRVAPALPASMPGTSRAELTATVSAMTARLAADPANAAAVVSLANALIRLQRVNNDGRAVITAEEHLRAFLARQARITTMRGGCSPRCCCRNIASATRSPKPTRRWRSIRAMRGTTAPPATATWSSATTPRAFEAFDRMGQLQPGPPAYARTAYALEIKGDLEGALEYMRRAADGTSPNDPESQAWHYAQVGDLLLQLGRAAAGAHRIRTRRRDVPRPSAGDRGPGAREDASTAISQARALDAAVAAGEDRDAGSGDARSASCRRRSAMPTARRAVLPDGRADRARRVGQRPRSSRRCSRRS